MPSLEAAAVHLTPPPRSRNDNKSRAVKPPVQPAVVPILGLPPRPPEFYPPIEPVTAIMPIPGQPAGLCSPIEPIAVMTTPITSSPPSKRTSRSPPVLGWLPHEQRVRQAEVKLEANQFSGFKRLKTMTARVFLAESERMTAVEPSAIGAFDGASWTRLMKI